jgi:hypothetical protein
MKYEIGLLWKDGVTNEEMKIFMSILYNSGISKTFLTNKHHP